MSKTDHRFAIRRSGFRLSRAGRGAAEPVGSRRRRARHQARAHPRQPHRRSRRAARSHRAGEGGIIKAFPGRGAARQRVHRRSGIVPNAEFAKVPVQQRSISCRAAPGTRRQKIRAPSKKIRAPPSGALIHPTSSRPATGRARRIPKNSLSRACPYRKTGLHFSGTCASASTRWRRSRRNARRGRRRDRLLGSRR